MADKPENSALKLLSSPTADKNGAPNVSHAPFVHRTPAIYVWPTHHCGLSLARRTKVGERFPRRLFVYGLKCPLSGVKRTRFGPVPTACRP